MTLWIAFAVLLAVALFFVVRPLVRRRGAEAGRADYDLEVYRDQLVEIERDAAGGLIGAAEAEAARIEVQRRVLAAGDAGPAPARARPLSRGAVFMVALALPILAGGLYLMLGRPGLPGAPASSARGPSAADIQAAAKLAPEERMKMIRGMVEGLAARLKENPSDVVGWRRLGRAWGVLGDHAKSAEAYEEAWKRAPKHVETLRLYILASMRAHPRGQPLTPKLRLMIGAFRDLAPDHPLGLLLAGESAAQDGRRAEAVALWRRFLATLPEKSPIAGVIRKRIAELETPAAPPSTRKAPE